MDHKNVYSIDKDYQGEKSFTVCGYLETEPGFVQIFRPKRSVYLSFDGDRHAVFIHTEFYGGKYICTIPFSEIERVTTNISQREKNRWYTTILSKRAYTLLFKDHHAWFRFTEAFRHVHKDGVKDALFLTNAGYLEFETSYASSHERKKYLEEPKPESHDAAHEGHSDEDHHKEVHSGLSHHETRADSEKDHHGKAVVIDPKEELKEGERRDKELEKHRIEEKVIREKQEKEEFKQQKHRLEEQVKEEKKDEKQKEKDHEKIMKNAGKDHPNMGNNDEDNKKHFHNPLAHHSKIEKEEEKLKKEELKREIEHKGDQPQGLYTREEAFSRADQAKAQYQPSQETGLKH